MSLLADTSSDTISSNMQPQNQYQPPYGQQPVPQYTAGSQKKTGSRLTLIALIVVTVFMLVVTGFAVWAFLERNDYKDNTDSKVATAVKVAVEEEAAKKDAEFVEKEKLPTKTYNSPGAYGSISFDYPKTWSGYMIEKDTTQEQLNGYFHPNLVPDVAGDTKFALRMQVIDKRYAEVIKSYASKIKTGKISSGAYTAPNVMNAEPGARLSGEVATGKTNGVMVVLPLRDKTLVLSTESQDFVKDFDSIVLKSLTYSP